MEKPQCELLPVDQWVKASRTDEFYKVMVEGGFRDAEDLARFLLSANARLRERILTLTKPATAVLEPE